MAITITLGPRESGIPKIATRVLKTISSIVPLKCLQEGWDDEVKQYEKCGSLYSTSGCGCHPQFCPECSAEHHGISLALPGLMESSALEHHCSSKGNW